MNGYDYEDGDYEDVPVFQVTEQPSAVIVALPAVTTVLPHDQNSYDLHATLAYVENPDPLELMAQVAETAAGVEPFQVSVSGHGRLGDDDAAVLLLESQELADLHQLFEQPDAKFPNYIPHLTLGWGGDFPIESLDMSTLPTEITFDRLAVWVGDERHEYALAGHDVYATGDMGDLVPQLEAMPDWDDQGDSLAAAAGVSIPVIDTLDDLPVALAYARENVGARWYVAKRAVALGASAALNELLPEAAAEAPPPVPDAELEITGPGGVQAAAQHYIRLCSYGERPDETVYAQLTAAAAAHGLEHDQLVASAAAWHSWWQAVAEVA